MGGRDSVSKVAAYNAGAVPSRRVPETKKLEQEGLIPTIEGVVAAAQGQAAPGVPDVPVVPGGSMDGDDNVMGGVGNMDGDDGGSDEDSMFVDTPANEGPQTPHNAMKAPGTTASAPAGPAPFAHMTPEVMESIEDDGKDDATMLRNELADLVKTLKESTANLNGNGNGNGNGNSNGSNMGAQQNPFLQNPPAQLGFAAGAPVDNVRVAKIEQRMAHLENVVHAMQNVFLPPIVERVNHLEQMMQHLAAKVGDGADAEVAKMREVLASLSEALTRYNGFL